MAEARETKMICVRRTFGARDTKTTLGERALEVRHVTWGDQRGVSSEIPAGDTAEVGSAAERGPWHRLDSSVGRRVYVLDFVTLACRVCLSVANLPVGTCCSIRALGTRLYARTAMGSAIKSCVRGRSLPLSRQNFCPPGRERVSEH